MMVTAHAVTRHVDVAHTKVASHPQVDLPIVARMTTPRARDRVIMTIPLRLVDPAAVVTALTTVAIHAMIALALDLGPINPTLQVVGLDSTLQNRAHAASDALKAIRMAACLAEGSGREMIAMSLDARVVLAAHRQPTRAPVSGDPERQWPMGAADFGVTTQLQRLRAGVQIHAILVRAVGLLKKKSRQAASERR